MAMEYQAGKHYFMKTQFTRPGNVYDAIKALKLNDTGGQQSRQVVICHEWF